MFRKLALATVLVLSTAGVSFAQSSNSNVQTVDQSAAAVGPGSTSINQATQTNVNRTTNIGNRGRRTGSENASDQFIIQTGVATDGGTAINQADQTNFNRTVNIRNRRR